MIYVLALIVSITIFSKLGYETTPKGCSENMDGIKTGSACSIAELNKKTQGNKAELETINPEKFSLRNETNSEVTQDFLLQKNCLLGVCHYEEMIKY